MNQCRLGVATDPAWSRAHDHSALLGHSALRSLPPACSVWRSKTRQALESCIAASGTIVFA
jgi:hypothetical protein